MAVEITDWYGYRYVGRLLDRFIDGAFGPCFVAEVRRADRPDDPTDELHFRADKCRVQPMLINERIA